MHIYRGAIASSPTEPNVCIFSVCYGYAAAAAAAVLSLHCPLSGGEEAK